MTEYTHKNDLIVSNSPHSMLSSTTGIAWRSMIVIMLMLFCPLFAVGQNGNYYNVDKHLSSSFVNQIYQDNRGFIWIATRNGLNRYDGYNFRIYKKGMPGCDGLASNIINCITQTDDNIILVGMFGGAQALYQDRF